MKATKFTHIEPSDAQEIVEKLNVLAANYHIYYSNLRGFHWHIEGRSFFTLHKQLEKMYDNVAERIDEIAERILQLDGVPVRFYKDIEEQASLKQATECTNCDDVVRQVLENISVLIKNEREIIELAADKGDEVTAGLLTDYLSEQEKLVWMLTAFMK